MNGTGDTFYDEATRATVEHYRGLVALWKRSLDRAQFNQIIDLSPEGFRDGLRGVALKLRYPVDMAHSGWLFRHMSDASAHEEASQVAGMADIGGDFKKLTQFSAVGAIDRLYIIATGPRATPILQAAIDSESRFDPNMFDSDGYLR